MSGSTTFSAHSSALEIEDERLIIPTVFYCVGIGCTGGARNKATIAIYRYLDSDIRPSLIQFMSIKNT